jgi:hypothetical protein
VERISLAVSDYFSNLEAAASAGGAESPAEPEAESARSATGEGSEATGETVEAAGETEPAETVEGAAANEPSAEEHASEAEGK